MSRAVVIILVQIAVINLWSVKCTQISRGDYNLDDAGKYETIEEATWVAYKGSSNQLTPGPIKLEERVFRDTDGCGGYPSINFFVYSKVFEPHICGKLNIFLNSYEEEDNQPGITKFYLGIVPVHNNDYGSLNPDKINQNFDVKAVKNASYSVPFGKIPLSTTQAFRLAIKAERMCGTWEFLSSNIDPDVYDISMSSTTCPSAAHRLSKFAEGCERKQSEERTEVYGECIDNSVPIKRGVRPAAYCFDFNNGYTFSHKDPFCMCKAGYEPDDIEKPTNCTLCKDNTFKAAPSNQYCGFCPEGSYSKGSRKASCACEYGKFRLKDNPNGPCFSPDKPDGVIVGDNDYTWINISAPRSFLSDENPFVVYVYETDPFQPGASPKNSYVLSYSRPYVFIHDLKANSEVTLFVCDSRAYDYSPASQIGYIDWANRKGYYEFLYGGTDLYGTTSGMIRDKLNMNGGKMDWRYFACEKMTITTREDISIKDLTIDVERTPRDTSPKLMVTWKRPAALEQPMSQIRFRYLVDIMKDGHSIWMSTLQPDETEVDFKVPAVEATYRADVSLEANGVVLYKISTRNISINKETVNASMSTLLVAVVGLILVILFIVFLLAVIFLRARRDNIYPPPISSSKSQQASLNMYDYDPLSVAASTTYNSEKWGTLCFDQPAAIRFIEPEAELLPYYERQGKSWQDLFNALEVRAIPVSTLDTEKLADVHKMLAKGQIGVCKVRPKENYDLQYDLKFCPHADDESIAYRSLVIEAATLAQLKHNHVVLMHGIVEYSTINNSVQLALLLEDCGTMTLQEYCSRSNTNHPPANATYSTTSGYSTVSGTLQQHHQPGIIEKLQHLRSIATALEHFSQLQYVHKVLKSENILINGNGVCRVAGFEDRVEFNKQPHEMLERYLRFWPPEVIKEKVFTLGTDIWSFGVLVWQCFNPTEPQPFHLMTDSQVEKYVLEGHSLSPSPSDTMPPKLTEVMKACFAYTPLHRPTAFDLKELIHSMLFPTRSPDYSYNSADYNTIRFLLEQNKMLKYQDLFEIIGVDRIEQIQWTDSYLKTIGIQDKRHRRRLIAEASKVLHGKAISPV